jgi:hypothetical protein
MQNLTQLESPHLDLYCLRYGFYKISLKSMKITEEKPKAKPYTATRLAELHAAR